MGHQPPGGGTGVLAALRSPSFATLLAGYACSAVGDGMAAVAISWLAIELSRGRDAGCWWARRSAPTPCPAGRCLAAAAPAPAYSTPAGVS
jgi:hypothetical protein